MNQEKFLGDLRENHVFPFLHYVDVFVSCSTHGRRDVLPELLFMFTGVSVVLFITKHLPVAV